MADDPKDITTSVAPSKLGGTFHAYVVDKVPAAKRHASWVEPDPAESKAGTSGEVTALLKDWLGQAAEKAVAGTKVEVHWTDSLPTSIRPSELFVYVTPAATSKFGKALVDGQLKSGHSGGTQLRSGAMLCEVWPDGVPKKAGQGGLVTLLAKLIFHEWLHFKLDADLPADQEVVHNLGNFGEPVLSEQPPHTPSGSIIDKLAENLAREFKFVR